MRQLSQFEQELILRMQAGDGNNLPNLIDPFLRDIRVRCNRELNQVELLAQTTQAMPDDQETQQVLDTIDNTSQVIISAVNLINLLDKEGYIILYTTANQIDNEMTYGQGAVNMPSVSYDFPDERVKELLIKYSTQEIVFTPEATEYVTSNFITRDEQRHRESISLSTKSLKYARNGIIIAISTVLIGIGFDIYDRNKPKDTIQQENFESIDADLDKTNENLENLIELQTQEVELLQENKNEPIETPDGTKKKKANGG